MAARFRLICCPFALLLVATNVISAAPELPRATVTVEEANGVEIRDAYRWMEKNGPEFDAWARAESDYARSTLDALPGRKMLADRIKTLDTPTSGIRGLQVRHDRWIYERADPGSGQPSLFVRKGRLGKERAINLFRDLAAEDGPWTEVHAARLLSPNGRFLMFGTTQKGEAHPAIRIYDLDDDRLLPDSILWPLWADSNGFQPRWLDDSSGFFYVRRADASASMGNTARARRGQIFLHRIDGAASLDRALFGFGITAEISEADTLYVQGEPDRRWLTIWRRMPDARELWVVDLQQLESPEPPRARKIWTSDVSVPGYGVHGNDLFVVDSSGSPRFRVIRFDLLTDVPTATEVLPEQAGVLTHLIASKDAVYVVETLLSRARLHVIGGRNPRVLNLEKGAVVTLSPGLESRGVWISQVDWLMPEHGRFLDPGNTSQLKTIEFDTSNARPVDGYTTETEWAIARDGERIPYTIVQRKDAVSDGSAYVMLDGYGCFGSATPPFHWPALNAWLENGGVFVRAAMRGGGELGADWHRAGRDRNKPVAFEDAIDVAKHLIREKITRPGRIGVTGASCGGITMGMAALEAPHLIGAAVLSVGAFDPWRLASESAAGARSIRDIGNPMTDDGTRRIFALSPYMQVLDDAPRPGMLIANGATDYTIPLWVGGKMVARTRSASPQGKPVLWTIQWNAGHNIGVDYLQADTDAMTFLFWQLGHPDFQR
ncbi:MAG: prolyl oligopeptidase family serine peptidase [Dokdonella sp.]